MRGLVSIFLIVWFGCTQAQYVSVDTLKGRYKSLIEKESYSDARSIAWKIKSYAHPSSIERSITTAIGLRYIGETYFNENKLDSAIFYYRRAYELLRKERKITNIEYGYTLTALAEYYMYIDQYKLAEPFQLGAVDLFGKYPNYIKDYAEALLQSGVLYNQMGQYKKAQSYYLRCLATEKKIYGAAHINIAKTLYYLGILAYNQDDYPGAISYYKKSLSMREGRQDKNHVDYISNLRSLAGLLYDEKKYDEAEIHYQSLLASLAGSVGQEHLDYLECLTNIYYIYVYLDNPDSTRQYTKKVLDLTGKLCGNNHQDYAEWLGEWSYFFRYMGDDSTARIHTENALKIAENVFGTDSDQYGEYAYNLGNIYCTLNNFDSAFFYLIRSLAIQQQAPQDNYQKLMSVYHSIGVVYFDKGEYKSAEIYFQRADSIAKNNTVTPESYAWLLRTMGSLKRGLGSLDIAEIYYLKSLKLIETAYGNRHSEYAAGLNLLGILYNDIGSLEKADSFYSKALDIVKENYGEKDPKYINKLRNLGVVYFNMGQYEKAINIYKKVMKSIEDEQGRENSEYSKILKYMGILVCCTDDQEANRLAENYFCEALEIERKLYGENNPDYISTLGHLAEVYTRQGEFPTAGHYFNSFFKKKVNEIQNNFSWLSSTEREKYWDQETENFADINEYAFRSHLSHPNAVELAYNATLVEKSILLETSRELDDAIFKQGNKALINIFNELKQLRALIHEYEIKGAEKRTHTETYRAKADSLDKVLMLALDFYKSSKLRFGITWNDIQANLKKDEAAIEFIRYRDHAVNSMRYGALINKKDKSLPKLIKLGLEAEIIEAIRKNDLVSLYKLVWEPSDTVLQNIKTIYYSPVGELNNAPFNAFCLQAATDTMLISKNDQTERGLIVSSDKTDCKCEKFLIDKYTLHQLTTTRYIADGTLKDRQSLTHTAYLVGGVNYDVIPRSQPNSIKYKQEFKSGSEFKLQREIRRAQLIQVNKRGQYRFAANQYLPGTLTEVKNIGALLGDQKWTVKIKENTNADEEAVKREITSDQPGILHIATHGFAFPDGSKLEGKTKQIEKQQIYMESSDPMVRCGLMLSGSNISWTGSSAKMIEETKEDGILTAAEVSNLNLSKTKLVVLSACETGLGKIEGSEGTFGLKRAFKLAGVEQLIVSLWKVPDIETMELMTHFYQTLTQSLDPVQSFQEAQKKMRVKYPTEPEKWAGFVLVR